MCTQFEQGQCEYKAASGLVPQPLHGLYCVDTGYQQTGWRGEARPIGGDSSRNCIAYAGYTLPKLTVRECGTRPYVACWGMLIPADTGREYPYDMGKVRDGAR